MDTQVQYDKIVRWWKTGEYRTEADLVEKLYNFRILFAYNSNKIENSTVTYHDTREIFENGKVINYTGDLRTLFDIQNQKNAFEFLLQPILKKEPLSIIKNYWKVVMMNAVIQKESDRELSKLETTVLVIM